MPIVEVHCRTAAFEGGETLNDVFVSVHPQGGGNALASGTTGQGLNQSGSVSLGVLAEGTYEIHITPALPATLQDGSLQEIVVSGVEINVFDVLVDTSGLVPSVDNHFCRCSGTFKDPYGKAIPNLKIHFSEHTLPQLLHYVGEDTNHAVIPKSLVVSTDSSGFASVDLLRGYTYTVYMEGYENLSRTILAPDLAASPLPDVLFPTLASVEYTHPQLGILDIQAPTMTMTVGESVTLGVETVHRSGVRVDGLVSVSLRLNDDSDELVESLLSGGDLKIEAKSTGVASFTLSLNSPEDGMGIRSLPETVIVGELSVTVLPE
tara:strand:+ start:195 stop:1154 length:960 start_codon:yes stop_codon:yes gene_type:complete